MSEPANVTISDNPGRHRFEARSEAGVIAGVAQYFWRGETLVLAHTEVDDAFEGQGVGSALARGALDQVRASGQPVLIACPFLKAYVARHPEYADLPTE